MNSISDSDAYFNPERMLVQHQAALTLLQDILSDPIVTSVNWLDIACGRGQIIANLKTNLSDSYRAKICYHGYDIDNGHTRNAKRVSESLRMKAVRFEIGEISRFSAAFPPDQRFEFITLTNTVHEIFPKRLASILFDSLSRLSDNGRLFIYDMETLPSPELGAVTWSAGEIKSIISTMCNAIGAANYEPAVGQWQHQSCNGWNVQLRRQHLSTSVSLSGIRERVIQETADRLCELIDQKLSQTRTVLESLTQYGTETGEEAKVKDACLYNFWALTRATGTPQ
ncbi:methyltransferase domain-containing protein [Singulisphaera sp. PoT]|uniref:methyltransferase domain-containing protein n=1 Tax=Singulisphaera sp. PoT TaxID=3411797 RepID=UPI003BF5C230